MTRFLNDGLHADNGSTIGQIPVPLCNVVAPVNATLTDNNAGQGNAPDISINVAAGQTAVIPICGPAYLKIINSFLSATSVPSVYADGTLKVLGGAPVPKGTQITGFELAYSVQGGPLTTINFRADLVTYANGAAISNAVLFANAELGAANRANTASATTTRIVSNANALPLLAYDITDDTYVYMKVSPVTPGGCTFRLYSVMINVTWNYN